MAPVVIELRTGTVPIYRPQYPLREEQIAGIEKTIEGLLQAGVLERTGSPWNTPINPVPKPGKPDYRMVHDLRLVNKVVVPTHYGTPNPYTMLNAIGPDKRWFTCIDLANAFFCVPLAVRSRQMFAFTYKGRQYTYTRLPQGYVDSPSIFNHVLETILAELELPEGVVLLQYVDDILLAGTSSGTIMSATRTVLQWLQENGFKVSKLKLQIGRQKVNFLGRIVSPSGQAMTDTQKSSILQHPRPTTVREMMKFLGLATWS
uniref:ribonuclease H n=1 Tax=Gasterosteus aculeatus aculeatus TaxID=481459 RepID=A0AAQ4S6G5_GASAC